MFSASYAKMDLMPLLSGIIVQLVLLINLRTWMEIANTVLTYLIIAGTVKLIDMEFSNVLIVLVNHSLMKPNHLALANMLSF